MQLFIVSTGGDNYEEVKVYCANTYTHNVSIKCCNGSSTPPILQLSKPDYSVTYTGLSGFVEVDYSGYYDITCAGPKGTSYGATACGGSVVKTRVWLNKGDVLYYRAKTAPSTYTIEGDVMTIPAAHGTTLAVNDKQIIYAAPGPARSKSYSVPSGVNKVLMYRAASAEPDEFSVHWHNGGDGRTLYAAYNPGGCYGGSGHTHNATGSCRYESGRRKCGHWDCILNTGDTQRFQCSGCGARAEQHDDTSGNGWGMGDHYVNYEYYACGSPTNTWNVKCGYQQGQIVGLYTLSSSDSVGGDVSVNSNFGAGYVKIQLAECNNLFNNNAPVKSIYYMNNSCNVVIDNDVVVYCKHS